MGEESGRERGRDRGTEAGPGMEGEESERKGDGDSVRTFLLAARGKGMETE